MGRPGCFTRGAENGLAPGAGGNVATEDLAFMLAAMGGAAGVDVPRLLALRAARAEWLSGERLFGALARAGLPTTFAAETMDR